MRSRQQQKAIFAHLGSKDMFRHLDGAIKIKEVRNKFSWEDPFQPTNSVIIADAYRTDVYGNPAGQIGIGPGMGIAASRRPKKG